MGFQLRPPPHTTGFQAGGDLASPWPVTNAASRPGASARGQEPSAAASLAAISARPLRSKPACAPASRVRGPRRTGRAPSTARSGATLPRRIRGRAAKGSSGPNRVSRLFTLLPNAARPFIAHEPGEPGPVLKSPSRLPRCFPDRFTLRREIVLGEGGTGWTLPPLSFAGEAPSPAPCFQGAKRLTSSWVGRPDSPTSPAEECCNGGWRGGWVECRQCPEAGQGLWEDEP